MTMMTCFATLIFALTFIATNVNAIVGESEFCWKKGKPRGAGRIPKACAPGYQRIGLLCYEDCDEGYIRVPGSVDCIQQCPKNEPGKPTWRNDGAYCRLAEYNRGGIAPKDTIGGGCSSDKVLSAGLCYKPCKDGYARGATRCWAKCFHEGHELYNRENYRNDGAYCYKRRGARGCPPNTRNIGVSCRKKSYEAGAGIVPKHCGPDRPEFNGGLCYKRCKPGYRRVGCCVCRPNRPKCGAIGMGHQVDLSCAKKWKHRRPHIAECSGDMERQAGLCYKFCPPGYRGVGPVCWSKAPVVNGKQWVGCGMAAAVDKKTCGLVIAEQILSVTSAVFNLITLGAGSALTKLSNVDELAGASADMADAVTKANKAAKAAKLRKVVDTVGTVSDVVGFVGDCGMSIADGAASTDESDGERALKALTGCTVAGVALGASKGLGEVDAFKKVEVDTAEFGDALDAANKNLDDAADALKKQADNVLDKKDALKKLQADPNTSPSKLKVAQKDVTDAVGLEHAAKLHEAEMISKVDEAAQVILQAEEGLNPDLFQGLVAGGSEMVAEVSINKGSEMAVEMQKEEKKRIHAADAVRESIAIVAMADPTGLVSAGASFIYPMCHDLGDPRKEGAGDELGDPVHCADEGDTCTCKGGSVKFGVAALGRFSSYHLTDDEDGSIECSRKVFGNPKRGTPKKCYCLITEGTKKMHDE